MYVTGFSYICTMKTIKLIPAWLIQGTDLIEGKGFELAKVSANHSTGAQRFITLDDGESWIKEESWTNSIRFSLEDAQGLLELEKRKRIEYYNDLIDKSQEALKELTGE